MEQDELEAEQVNPLEAPGTLRGKEIQRFEDQQGFGDNFSDAFRTNTAAGAAMNVLDDEQEPLKEELFGTIEAEDESDPLQVTAAAVANVGAELVSGAAAILGFRAGDPDYDKNDKYDELTEGIPYGYHDEILGNTNFAAAQRTRARIKADIERGRKLASQQGMSSGLAVLAGSVVDIDLPLTFMTGGGFGAAKIAQGAARVGATGRVGSVALGANAGLQAGGLSGLGNLAVRETSDWTMVAEYALMGTVAGGALNGALRGDIGLQLKAAQDELHARIARDDPSLSGTDLDVNNMRVDPVRPILIEDVDSTVGASATQPRPGVERVADVDQTPVTADITRMTENWRHDTDWLARKRVGEDEWLEKFITRGAGSKVASDYASLYRSESPTLNFLAGAIYESPHGYGRGRKTASVGLDQNTRQFVEPTFRGEDAMFRWAKRNQSTFAGSGVGISEAAQRQFSREVMLEVNAMRLGRKYSDDVDVRTAADAYGVQAAGTVLDSAKRAGVDGFENIDAKPYLPYRWSGTKLRDMIKSGAIKEADMVDGLANAYRKAGMAAERDAEAIAKAVVTRMRASADGVSGSLQDLMSRDGRDYLHSMLTDAGTDAGTIDAILRRITGEKDELGKSSHAKARNEIDLEAPLGVTADGQTIKVVDLMDDNLHNNWHRYARSMAGATALAEQGVKNRAMREQMISAARREQDALGEEVVNPDLLRAMFTHFDGGPISGFSRGRTNSGIGQWPALAKRLTNLSLLGKLGITQLGETGASMAAVGLSNWAERGVMSRLSKEGLEANKALLDDISYMTGRIGEDHRHFAPHLELDSLTAKEGADFASGLSGMLGKAQYVQAFTSGFNTVRKWQQTTAAMGIVDRVVRGISDGADDKLLKRMESDLGIDVSHVHRIKELIEDGTIELRTTARGNQYTHRLNMDKWDVDLAEEVGAAITRSVNQQVQKSLAGEQDAWLHTEWGSILMHLKTFPMQAVTKQVARNMRHMDQQNWATVGMGLATAYAAVSIRDALDGRERDSKAKALAAISYSNMTGFIPMSVDPMLTMLGLEDRRFSPFGPHTEVSIPTLDVANRLMRVPGALADYATGEANGYDRQAVMAIPFASTAGILKNLATQSWD